MARHATDVIFISSSDFVSNPVNSNTKETSEVNTTEPKVEDAEDTDQEPTCHHKWLCTGHDSHSNTSFFVCRHCRAECEM